MINRECTAVFCSERWGRSRANSDHIADGNIYPIDDQGSGIKDIKVNYVAVVGVLVADDGLTSAKIDIYDSHKVPRT